MTAAAERLAGTVASANPMWLLAAIAFHVAGQVARGRAWHGVLRTAWPGAPLCPRSVSGCFVTGAGLSGVLPARGADVVRVLLVRRRLPEAGVPALAGTLAVEGLLDALIGGLLILWVAARGAEAIGGGGGAPVLVAVGAGLALAVVAVVVTGRPRRLRAALGRAARGLEILRRPRAFLTLVLPWQLAGRAARLVAVGCFLAAFAVPVSLAAVACVAATQGAGRAVPVPGASTGAGAALLLTSFPAATGQEGHGAALAALSIGMPLLLTAVGVALSLALLSRQCGTASPRTALRRLRAEPA